MILQPKDNDSFVIPEPDRNVIGFYHEYEEHGCFSNWYHAEFDYAGKHFTSAEQFMMYHKVMMFRQYDLGERILQSDSPSEMKKLGRTYFPEFNADVWDKASYTIVKRGVRAKFEQNPDKAEILCRASGVELGQLISIDYNWGELNIISRTSYEMEDCLMSPASMGKCCAPEIEPDDIDVSDSAAFVWEIG